MIWTGENKILKMLTEGLLSLKGGKIMEQTVGGKCKQHWISETIDNNQTKFTIVVVHYYFSYPTCTCPV